MASETTDKDREFRPLIPDGEDVPCDGCDRPATRRSEALRERLAETDIEGTGALCGKCYQDLVRFAVSRRFVASISENTGRKNQ